jgi:hypothetical protein
MTFGLVLDRWMKTPFEYGTKYNMPCANFRFKAKKVFRHVDHLTYLLKDTRATVGDDTMLDCTVWAFSSSRLLLEMTFSNRPEPVYTLYKLSEKKNPQN